MSALDQLTIHLDHPTYNPCCVNLCPDKPTFDVQVFFVDGSKENKYKGNVYICKGHYLGARAFPEFVLGQSTILQQMLEE